MEDINRNLEVEKIKIMENELKPNTDFQGSSEQNKQPRQEKKKKGFGTGVVVGIIVCALIFTSVWGVNNFLIPTLMGGNFQTETTSRKDVEKKLNLLNGLISQNFLYEDEIDKDELIEGIYSGYVSALKEPYTEYYDKRETKEIFESTSGEFSGIGASMTQNLNTRAITILEVYEGSPADQAGLKTGDILYQVDDKMIEDEDLSEIVSWIKGEKGTKVVLHVLRNGEEMEFTAIRDTIEAKTVYYEMKENQTGYIRITEFDQVTYEQFELALNDLEQQGMKGLIVDVRNNPGGDFDVVINMLRLLLPKGVVVSTKDKYDHVEEFTCDGSHEFTKPLAVLINQNSASASEIFAGAIQDYEKGKLVGMKTFGKGIVQGIIKLHDGTSIKMTTAEYYTPSGRNIHGKGIEPDVEVEFQYDETNPDRDNQLEEAMKLLAE